MRDELETLLALADEQKAERACNRELRLLPGLRPRLPCLGAGGERTAHAEGAGGARDPPTRGGGTIGE